MKFKQKFNAAVRKNNSLLCIGLDPDPEKLPLFFKKKELNLFAFNKKIIDATHDLVCAYKPNIAFYESCGLQGLGELKKTIEYLKISYPHIPIVLDAKRGDIGSSSRMYAKAVFEYWAVDAVTVFSVLGLDTLEPFFDYKDKLIILLIKTSNPDSRMFQDMRVGKMPFYNAMATKIKKWQYENIGLFVGATYPKELKEIRKMFPDHLFLSAGLGVQGGSTREAVCAGIDRNAGGIMFNASRSVLYASNGSDFDVQAREAAIALRDSINRYRKSYE